MSKKRIEELEKELKELKTEVAMKPQTFYVHSLPAVTSIQDDCIGTTLNELCDKVWITKTNANQVFKIQIKVTPLNKTEKTKLAKLIDEEPYDD